MKYEVAAIGDSYSKPEQSVFLQDLENMKAELFVRLWQRQSQFNFTPLSYQNNFQCKESTAWEGSTCNDQKVVAAVKAYNLPKVDTILLLAKKIFGGGGGAICIGGTAYHNTVNSGSLDVHEFMHSAFGLAHDGMFMNGSGGHGADGYNMTFTPAQFATINARLNQVAGAFASPVPTIQITGTQFLAGNGNTLIINGKATGNVQFIEVVVDNVSKGTLPYWERNFYCNQKDGIKFFNNPTAAGTHTIKLVATDCNGQTATAQTTITV